MMKTIERAHQPAKMWEKVQLSDNYQTALKQVCVTEYLRDRNFKTDYI